MASPISNSSFAILALLISSLFFTPSSAITQADVTSVCSKSLDPGFCSTYLMSIPGLSTATFKDLSQDTINTIVTRSGIIVSLISNLQRGLVDPSESKSLAFCSQSYHQMVDQMRTALQSLVLGERPQVLASASAGIGLCAGCARELHGTAIVLGSDNQSVKEYLSTLVELSKRL